MSNENTVDAAPPAELEKQRLQGAERLAKALEHLLVHSEQFQPFDCGEEVEAVLTALFYNPSHEVARLSIESRRLLNLSRPNSVKSIAQFFADEWAQHDLNNEDQISDMAYNEADQHIRIYRDGSALHNYQLVQVKTTPISAKEAAA